MLVFFMLATNFNKNQEISFSINNQIKVSEDFNEKMMIIYLKNNQIIFEEN